MVTKNRGMLNHEKKETVRKSHLYCIRHIENVMDVNIICVATCTRMPQCISFICALPLILKCTVPDIRNSCDVTPIFCNTEP